MKKILIFVIVLVIAFFAYDYSQKQKTQTEETPEAIKEGDVVAVTPQFDVTFEAKTYKFTKDNLDSKCDMANPMLCSIDLTVKCTINQKLSICEKEKMPKFVFMEDESLRRPSFIEYRIVGVRPINKDTIEVRTESVCDGTWFGLCNGNIIYVLNQRDNYWRVKDIYAIE